MVILTYGEILSVTKLNDAVQTFCDWGFCALWDEVRKQKVQLMAKLGGAEARVTDAKPGTSRWEASAGERYEGRGLGIMDEKLQTWVAIGTKPLEPAAIMRTTHTHTHWILRHNRIIHEEISEPNTPWNSPHLSGLQQAWFSHVRA